MQQASNVVDISRVVWDRQVDKAFSMYDYHCNLERLVDELERLGFDREEVIDLVNDQYDD